MDYRPWYGGEGAIPYVVSGDARIYYEVRGHGPPLVLVEGLGAAMWMWTLQVEDLSRDHMLIIFDNRGVGKSDKPGYPYTMDMMADDLRNVLDAVGVEKAHILGVSMGGMIAQHFALKNPARVKSLILVSTHHGGREIDPPSMEVLNVLIGPPPAHVKTERDLIAYRMSYVFPPGWLERKRELFEALVDLIMREPQSPEVYLNQARAILAFDASPELHRIEVPTLIMHGDQDKIVPVGNAYKLHKKIRNSKLIIFRGAGHAINAERVREFNNQVRMFIKSVEEGRFTRVGEPIVL